MFKLYVSLVCIVLQTLGIFGHNRNNKTVSTTAKPFSDLLSKFHQNDFIMTFERIELARFDKRYVNCQIRTFKYNRTTPVIIASCTFNIDVGNEMEMIIQAYRFASNEYRVFPIHFQLNFCETTAASAVGFDKLIKTGNVVCPLIKGKKYYVNNFTPASERFPPFIPNGHYMVELQFWYQSKEYFALYDYGSVDRPMAIPDA